MEKCTEMIVNERVSTSLSTHDFYFDLPEELIAQSPSEERDLCRLLVLDRQKSENEHKVFRDIIDYLRPEDILVVNSSKVIPARLLGTTEKTGSSMELLLLKALEGGDFSATVSALFNRFEAAVAPERSAVLSLKEELLRYGANAVQMSGSGPTVFGLFTDKNAANEACEYFLENGYSDHAFLTKFYQPA